MAAAVHGDDITLVGNKEDAQWVRTQFQKRYEIKSQHIGEQVGMDREASVLNRKIWWTNNGIMIEAVPRHSMDVISSLGLTDANPVNSPMTTEPKDHKGGKDEVALEGEEVTRYGAVAARLSYFAQAQADLGWPP